MDKKLSRFVLVNGDYWQAFYVDGEKIDEHHELDLVSLLHEQGVDIESKSAYKWCEDNEGFPDTLDEIVFDEETK